MDCKKKEVRKGRKYNERIEKNSEGEGRKERKTEQKKGKGGSRQGKGQGYIHRVALYISIIYTSINLWLYPRKHFRSETAIKQILIYVIILELFCKNQTFSEFSPKKAYFGNFWE